MASKKKGKKRKNLVVAKGFGAKNLSSELKRAEALMAREDWQSAIALLTELSQSNPKETQLWDLLLEAYFQTQNPVGYQAAGERIAELSPNRADIAYALGGAYIMNQHPFLALQSFQRALQLNPASDKAKEANLIVEQLETETADLLNEMGFAEADRAIALLHERGQSYLSQGDYAKARAAEEAVTQAKPEFLSSQNNLSLIAWMSGDPEAAIATSQQVLRSHPDNIHALSNLVRYHAVLGQMEAAQAVGDRLKASNAPAWDSFTKKAEGLSYLGDDAGVIEIFEAAIANGEFEQGTSNPLLHHFAAVALARSDRESEAKKQWKLALAADPNLDIAQANLDDLLRPLSQRNTPYPFETDSWLPRQVMEDSFALIKRQEQKGETIGKAFGPLLKTYPYLLSLMPILLERGSPSSREMAINLALNEGSEASLTQLKDYVLGQQGPDSMRYEAAIALTETQTLDTKQPTRLWLGGQWQEVRLLAQDFHDEPLYNHSKQVERWVREGTQTLKLMTPESAAQAQALFEKAIAAEPNKPDLQYNLAAAYQVQGLEVQATNLRKQIAEQFPDYLFAQVSLADLELNKGNPEAAEAILKPLLTRERFHFSEYANLSECYLQTLMALKKVEQAQTWLKMWQRVTPDHPRIEFWQSMLT